ncbi:hypothetical protein IM697_37985 [Streptomyces ferrugineus]|uniref:Integral membrane protein n=1 Tax=Streptomyces ferrugineus TaxID=1413221 RepID=A0A7M2SHE0_9ACTN|nr:hypothetical protein [Streptomyces ferrugineus]QOV35777.1 hypothetical protein IM697_37985 [Streptomyces ferrugineus]
MNGLGGLDRPAAPTSPGAWDERSEEWLADQEHTTPTEEPTTAARPARRTGADPVKALLHRHRDLCERAVDPLEIAAGLEAHGVTDRTAARFLHRDVFSLAEEMYARTPRDGDTPPGTKPLTTPRARADWILLTLLPGALCGATVVGLHLTHGQTRLITAAAGALALPLALRAALARGPLAARHAGRPTATRIGWLLVYALLGDGLLRAAAAGGPDVLPTGSAEGPWPLTVAPVLALALSCAPAAWCAHLLAVRARRKLSASRALKDFATSAKPLLLATLALYLGALTALLTLTTAILDEPAAHPQTLTLGALLFLSRLLTNHGFTQAPALVLTAAASAEATALTTLFTARLPGCDWLAIPVQTLVDTWGPAAIPTIACGAGTLTLLLHAMRTLTRASAHAPQDQPS